MTENMQVNTSLFNGPYIILWDMLLNSMISWDSGFKYM